MVELSAALPEELLKLIYKTHDISPYRNISVPNTIKHPQHISLQYSLSKTTPKIIT